MEWSFITFVMATSAVSLGALLQASTGLGAGLIIVPLLALISIDLIPGPMIFASLFLSFSMAFSQRQHINFDNLPILLSGISLGTLCAALVISHLNLALLGIVFGSFVLLAIVISIKAPQLSLSKLGYFSTGTISGIMGTAAGIGAPILALLYQHHSGPSLRSTLALLYFISSIIMLLFLHMADRFGLNELIYGFALVPGFILGFFISSKFLRFIDNGYARYAVLIISICSALLLIGRSIYSINNT